MSDYDDLPWFKNPETTWEEYLLHLEAVKVEIIQAFADVPYPGDDNLTGCQDWHPEDQELAEFLRGKDWRDLPDDYLCGEQTFLLTQAAYHYYLPAFLLAGCERNRLGVDIGWMNLLPKSPVKEGEKPDVLPLQERHAGFSKAQMRAIKHFMELRCYLRCKEAIEAYELYWQYY
jgi:hypothetical protein